VNTQNCSEYRQWKIVRWFYSGFGLSLFLFFFFLFLFFLTYTNTFFSLSTQLFFPLPPLSFTVEAWVIQLPPHPKQSNKQQGRKEDGRKKLGVHFDLSWVLLLSLFYALSLLRLTVGDCLFHVAMFLLFCLFFFFCFFYITWYISRHRCFVSFDFDHPQSLFVPFVLCYTPCLVYFRSFFFIKGAFLSSVFLCASISSQIFLLSVLFWILSLLSALSFRNLFTFVACVGYCVNLLLPAF